MSRACKCDLCGKLFEPVVGHVSFGYSIAEPDEKHELVYGGYDDNELCPHCSAAFLKFIKHEPA